LAARPAEAEQQSRDGTSCAENHSPPPHNASPCNNEEIAHEQGAFKTIVGKNL
jgi:hypothetical protein